MNYQDFKALVMPDASHRYGAQVGRHNVNDLPKETINGKQFFKPVKTTTRRIYLNNGGYDAGGAYWGTGAPLYVTYSKCGRFIEYFRKRLTFNFSEL